MCCKNWKGPKLWVMFGIIAFGAGSIALAQENQTGRVVRIGQDDPDQKAQSTPSLPPPGEIMRDDRPVAPKHWIGLTGGPLTPELRAHVDLPDDQGILVHEIVPNSPAVKAGLKQFDILLRANDKQLHAMPDLVDVVRTAGEKQSQITLEVLRKGQRQSLTVKPEERPADLALAPRAGTGGWTREVPNLENIPQLRQFMERFGAGDGLPLEFRQFGPGVVVGEGGAGGIANMPNGLSISVQKQNDQPARITVKRGDQTWEVIGDDPESLQQLPADSRPFVEQMLHGGDNRMFNFRVDGPGDNLPELGGPGINERLERMERQMRQFMEQQRAGNPSSRGDTK
jgi:hypothetical protein